MSALRSPSFPDPAADAGFAYAGAARQRSRGSALTATVVASLAVGIVAAVSCLDMDAPRPKILAISIPLAHDHAPGHQDFDGRS